MGYCNSTVVVVDLGLELVQDGVADLGRVGGGVDLLELADGYLRVDLGRREVGVSEQLLDEADVRAVLVHEGGAGVAEEVAGAVFADLGGLHVVPDKLRQAVRGEGLVEGSGTGGLWVSQSFLTGGLFCQECLTDPINATP